MTSKLRTPKVCPVCGEDVPRTALACPECGADHTSGWREDAETYDAVDLPDEDFNYEEFVKQEFGSSLQSSLLLPLSRSISMLLIECSTQEAQPCGATQLQPRIKRTVRVSQRHVL